MFVHVFIITYLPRAPPDVLCSLFFSLQDEVVDVFWWLKQSAAILTGVALGYTGVTGWLGFVTFAAFQYLVANLWAQHAQLVGVCIEPFEVFTESAFVAAGTFVVST